MDRDPHIRSAMTIKYPLYHRSGTILFLDDDRDYLEMLGAFLPDDLQIELYDKPAHFTDRMRDEPARWEADAVLQLQMIERWRRGQALLPQVLRYWGEHPERYELAQVCVIDYDMPETNGMQVLDTLTDWPGSRILLTGHADPAEAIRAFNQGLIDQFISKLNRDASGHVKTCIRALMRRPHPRLNAVWRPVLEPEQLRLLQDASVADALSDLAPNRWVEYVLLGAPFGILGLDARGSVQWLQLEPRTGLGDLSELAQSAGLPADDIEAIAQGQRLPAVEMHQQLGLPGPVRTATAFPIGDGQLLAAEFALEASALPLPIYPLQKYLDARSQRQILGD